MRFTLEQLKAMSDGELCTHWLRGGWPFDTAHDCDCCLAQHGRPGYCDVSAHAHLREAVPTHEVMPLPKLLGFLREHMEAFYAMRLFYDSLYPKSTEAAPQIEQAVASTNKDNVEPVVRP